MTREELGRLTIERLAAYRKKALSLENSLADSDYGDSADELDPAFIWFKEDPRWKALYNDILEILTRKQAEGRRSAP